MDNFNGNVGSMEGTSTLKNANVGDYIQIGRYPQTANGDIQPIEWQVLAIEENKMLLISKYGLEARRFDGSSNDWWNSEIIEWLNSDFGNKAFNEEEKKYISRKFLLSKEEAEEYFANNEVRKCKVTEYAIENGAFVGDYGYTCWWLRSSFGGFPYSSYHVDYVLTDGNFSHYSADYSGGVVRPALWIEF